MNISTCRARFSDETTERAAIWERVSPPKRENRPFHAGHTGEYPYDCRAT
ncbi:MAG: hypothetical protein J6B56_05380 [Clostridia bacterium]|nr:hypothetical protein [Clostridia bacterium]